MGRKEKKWTNFWGKPERITIEHDIDEMGRWVESHSRSDGPIHFLLSPLDLYSTKKNCEDAMNYSKRIREEQLKVHKKVHKEIYGSPKKKKKG